MASSRYRLQKLKGRRTGWPIGTLLLYGSNDREASKLVAGIVRSADNTAPEKLETWKRDGGDIRDDESVLAAVLELFEAHRVARVVTTDRIVGCPHQEGIDYHGPTCPDPACGFWIGINRWTGDTEH